MKFWEAVEVARRMGVKVLCVSTKQVALWKYEEFIWEKGDRIALVPGHLDADWRVIEPPPEYSFAEAYQMMKQGKWMKPNGSMDCRTQADGQPHGKWLVRQVGCLATYQFDCFPVAFIESKWTEAKD